MDPFMKMALDAVSFGIVNDAGFFDTMRALGYKFKGDEKKEEFERISKACHEEWLKAKKEEEIKKRERMEKKMDKTEPMKKEEVTATGSILDCNKPTKNGRVYSENVVKQKQGRDETKVFMENGKAVYTNPNIGEILLKNAKLNEKKEKKEEWKMPTDKISGSRVYVPIEVELKFSDDSKNFNSSIKHLGVFSDYRNAKRACDTERNCDDAKEGWKDIYTDNEEGFCCGTHCIYSAWFGLDCESMKLSMKIIVIFATFIDRLENTTFDPHEILTENTLKALANLLKNFEKGKRALFKCTAESIEELLLK